MPPKENDITDYDGYQEPEYDDFKHCCNQNMSPKQYGIMLSDKRSRRFRKKEKK